MNLIEIFSILIIHFIGDFVFQTDTQAKGKSNNWHDLLSHTASYSFIWLIALMIYTFPTMPWNDSLNSETTLRLVIFFPIITFLAHTTTDYFTSRLNSKLWKEGRIHDFFVSLGFDQNLHFIQLFLTYYLLTK